MFAKGKYVCPPQHSPLSTPLPKPLLWHLLLTTRLSGQRAPGLERGLRRSVRFLRWSRGSHDEDQSPRL